MKRGLLILTAVALLALAAPQVFADYSRSDAVTVMRASRQYMQEISAAIGKQDFHEAAGLLMELAQGHQSLTQMSPPGGSKAEWDRINSEMVAAAYRAIGAIGQGDTAKLQAEMGRISAMNREGHSTFRN